MADRQQARAAWIAEGWALLALAGPLVLGNVAWSGIQLTDLLLLGQVGPRAVGAGALALGAYTAFHVFGMGLVTAASPLIASERGRRRHAVRDIRRTVRQTLWVAALVALPIWAVLWHGEALLVGLGQEPALAAEAGLLLRGLMWALLPYLIYLTLRNFLAALERPGWGTAITLAAIPVNYAAGYVLIFGRLGLPPLGLFGAGLASSVTAIFMAAGLMLVVTIDRRFRRFHLFGHFWRGDRARFVEVWRIGLPIAVTLALEVGVFNAAVFLMGLIGEASLAAHAVAIQVSALAFMVPMGIGQAATVRVGIAHGRTDPAAAARAGWTALALGVVVAGVSAAVLAIWPRRLVAAFIDLGDPANAGVIALAIGFLRIAALFQLVDSLQAVAAGVLRGLQDTRVPMIFAAVGYWVIGIGVGTLLAFPLGLAGAGVWLGLASGLATVATLLVLRWTARERLGLVPGIRPSA